MYIFDYLALHFVDIEKCITCRIKKLRTRFDLRRFHAVKNKAVFRCSKFPRYAAAARRVSISRSAAVASVARCLRNQQSTGNGGDGGDGGDSSVQLAPIIANGRLITDD